MLSCKFVYFPNQVQILLHLNLIYENFKYNFRTINEFK